MRFISTKGIQLIESFESLQLKAYKCPAGVWTLGWGHTKGVTEGMTCSYAQAGAWLSQDLIEAEDEVDRAVDLDLSQDQFDALVMLTFNIGVGALDHSTLLKDLNAGDIPSTIEQWMRWNHANGKVLNGLTRRRLAEIQLFKGEAVP